MKMALCIPAYNAADHLGRLLADASAQTRAFDEIWVHDDASTDHTGAVARDHGARVLRSEQNVGCSMGKHRLLMETECELVHFHDADDGLHPDFVAETLACLAASSEAVDVLLVGFDYRDLATHRLLASRLFDDQQLRDDAVAYTLKEPINAICGVYRSGRLRDVGGYQIPDSQLYNEDQSFHCRLARAGLRFAALEKTLVTNFRVAGSMSGAAASACVAAQYEVMAEAAANSATGYHCLIARRLWQIAGSAAALANWPVADRAAILAAELDHRGPGEGHAAYRWLAQKAPRLAIRARQRAIRLLGKQPEMGNP